MLRILNIRGVVCRENLCLWSRDVEIEILAVCRELGIGFVPYSPLGRGFLTGRFRNEEDFTEGDYRQNHPRFQGENLKSNLNLLSKLDEFSKRKGCTNAQIALAWVLGQGEDLVPIPGTKRRVYLEENINAVDITLTEAEMTQLSNAMPFGVASGQRYAPQAMKAVNR